MAEPPLAGARILVPPARPEVNPLARMLRSHGATTRYFPSLQPRFPSSWASMDEALDERRAFDWIVFSGSNCVHNWMHRASERNLAEAIPADTKLMAIGHGAVRALRTEGRPPDHVPEEHVAEEIASGVSGLDGARILLVRLEGASARLPQALQAAGARVSAADGYEMTIRASAREARRLQPLDIIALANPTTVRFLERGAAEAHVPLPELAGKAFVAAVGSDTARAARETGLSPGLIADGRIADLARAIVRWWPDRPEEYRSLEEQALTFVGRFTATGAPERDALVATGADLVRHLRTRSMELGMSRGTEFSEELRRCDELATQIEQLVQTPESAQER